MSDFTDALHIQARVIHAFILRETRTRFGRSQLGYLWAFFEPLAYILSLLAIFYTLGRGAPINVDISLFFFSGIIPWLMFSRCVSVISGAIEGNQQLLAYPQVKTLDVIVARIILEFSTLFAVALFYVGGVFYLGLLDRIESALLVLLALFVATLLGAGLGLIGGIIKLYLPGYGSFQGVLLRVMFFTSGSFFVVDSLPALIVDWLWFNPMLHVTEWVRSAFFYEFQSRFYDWRYPVIWMLLLLFIGLSAERVSRYKLRQI